jgi:hypothetical protein
MRVTKKWLEGRKACQEAVEWYATQRDHDDKALFKQIIKEDQPLEWVNWYLSRRLEKMDRVRYAVYAAKQVLWIFEAKYPDDKRPRIAIQAAVKYLHNPNATNADAAYAANAAYAAAYAAAYTADAARAAATAYAAAYAAAHTADSADTAATTYAAIYAAAHAARATDAAHAAHATDAATKKQMQIKICRYGFRLLGKTKEKK